ncbi:MAG: GAF domain-containing protein, partial [bacterium]|nr:GAF domain-containing protein [bacterium]
DTVPIAQAGFEHPEEEGVALSTLQIPPDVQTAIYHADEKKNLKLPPAGQSYLVTCSALQSLNDENVGILCIGVPEAHVLQSQHTIRAQGIIMKQAVQTWMLGVGIASLALLVVISLVVATKIVNPLKQLSEISKKIATGDLQQEIPIELNNEIGVLADSFREIIIYTQYAADIAEKISNNDLQVEVTPKSEQDTLNISLHRMVNTLQHVATENERAMATVTHQNWLRTGQAELNGEIRGEQNIATLSKHIITYLANYVQAQAGLLYLTDEDQTLHLTGSYAYTTRKGDYSRVQLGERLVGQAAFEQKTILFADVPEDYMAIGSGLGETVPRQILVVPFLYEDKVIGVVELGTVQEFTEKHREFLNQVRETMAIAVNSTQARMKMQDLLKETQQQAEKLQVQQEELHQTNNQLVAQTNALEKRETTLQDKNRELERTRTLIEEKARDLELSSKYKSEFLANMSHELRTPLNSLLILSQVLSENEEGNLSAKQIEFTDIIHAAGEELLALINEVLDLSKVEAGKMTLKIEEMSVQGLSAYIRQNFQHVAEEQGLELNVHLSDSIPAAIGTDRQRVEQIVKNFLSNALKFTDQGSVTLSIDRPAPGTNLSHSGLTPHTTVAITVADTGAGVSEAKQRIIFESFQQADGSTSRKYGGTGLGLSISRELAKLLGGEIQLQSEEGRGSTFTLY